MKRALSAVLVVVMPLAAAPSEERRLGSYEVRVYGADDILTVERFEYDARCGVNPKEHLNIAGPDPASLAIDWSMIVPAPIRPPLLDFPTYKAEKLRILYRGELVGEIPGNRFHDSHSGFTFEAPFAVEKVIAVGDRVLVISVESADPPKEVIERGFPVLSNPDRVYIAEQSKKGGWSIEEVVVSPAESSEGMHLYDVVPRHR